MAGTERNGFSADEAPPALPQRVIEAIDRLQDRSERAISLVQLAIVVVLGTLWLMAPRPTDIGMDYDLAPWGLGLYLAFTLVRLAASCYRRLPHWFLALSVVVDIGLLMTLIWSFHLTYGQPPAFYLKAPTLLYAFIFIALRALRFEARYVLLAGATAAAGWATLVALAVAADSDGTAITRNFGRYMTDNAILLGAEFDKILAISIVTLVLAAAVTRSRRMLVQAVTEGTARDDLSRFFDAGVARRITGAEVAIDAGQGEVRDATVVFLDIRGFTRLATTMAPDSLMRLLSEYQRVVVPALQAAGGTIDKFLGDGIMATYGATLPSQTHAADALNGVVAALHAVEAWNAGRLAAGEPALSVGAGVASGRLVFGAVGDGERLEYTVIGEAVNLAAKLEKHTKVECVPAIATVETVQRARQQGWHYDGTIRAYAGRSIDGVSGSVDIVVFEARAKEPETVLAR
ncbi:MAG: adenylate/guanylate cyclase domain-containing protein [Alphaproteobacteria bacterium]